MDRIRMIETFVAAAEEGSLTKAAEKLRVSLPVVVRTLAALEQRLGVRLLNRTTRRSHLTEAGLTYLDRCKHLLNEFADVEQTVSAERSRPSGTVRVSAPLLFGAQHVAPAIACFLAQQPELNIDLTLTDRIVDLVEDGLDVSVRIGPLPDSTLIATPLGATQRVICASPDYIKRAGLPKSPRDLKLHNFLRFTAIIGTGGIVLQENGKAVRVPVRGNLASNSGAAIIDAALRGVGVASVFYYQIEKHVRDKKLNLILQANAPALTPIHAVYLQPRASSAKIRVFVEHLQTILAKSSFTP